MEITVERLTTAEPAMVDDINALLPQLTDTFTPETLEGLRATVADDHTAAIIAFDRERIIGMAYLCMYRTPLKKKGIVEEVVVDSKYQGKGLGTKIMQFLIEVARKEDLAEIELTSRPSREAANKLYQKLGFEKRETNVYRMKL